MDLRDRPEANVEACIGFSLRGNAGVESVLASGSGDEQDHRLSKLSLYRMALPS